MTEKFEQRFDYILNISQSNAETAKTQAMSIHELILKLSSSTSFKNKICTSEGVELNHKENWLCPVLPSFTNPCKSCGYYGHTQKTCFNILPSYRSSCTKCWNDGHIRDKCTNKKRDTPFRTGFVTPQKIIEKYMGYHIGIYLNLMKI